MKKLLLSLFMLAFVAITSNAFAQDATQLPGEQHKFSVTDHTSTGATYAWEVYTSAALSTVVGSNSNDNYIISGESTNEVTITWTNIAAGTYYVGVTETIGSCSTKRYTAIAVSAASYDLVVENKDDSGNAIDLTDCMEGAGRIFSKDATIDALDNVLYYTVSLENAGVLFTPSESWKFNYTLTVKDAAGNDKTASVEVVGTPAGVVGVATAAANSSTTVTVTGLDKFTIKVTVADNPGTSSDDNLEVNFAASSLKVGAGEVAETDSKSNSVDYVRSTYPNTSVITIN